MSRGNKWTRLVDNKMGDYGEINYQTKVIRINKEKSKRLFRGGIIDTIIHEEIHRQYPNLGERQVKNLTKKRLLKMARSTKQTYYNKYRKTK